MGGRMKRVFASHALADARAGGIDPDGEEGVPWQPNESRMQGIRTAEGLIELTEKLKKFEEENEKINSWCCIWLLGLSSRR
jgi:hypothetical protein